MSAQFRPEVSKYFKELSGTAKQSLTILVLGEPGSGKTTLVGNLLGAEITEEDTYESVNLSNITITTCQQKILEVPVIIHETCGPGPEYSPESSSDKNFRKILGNPDERQFVIIYCFKMCETRLRNSLVQSLIRWNEMGLEWEKTVIALTFADALPIPRAARQDPSFSQAKYFDERLIEWREQICTLLNERIGLPCVRVQMVPTTDSPQDPLPNQDLWYEQFWNCVLSTISKCGESKSLTQQPELESVAICTKAKTAAWNSERPDCHLAQDANDREPLLRKGAFEGGHGVYGSADDTSDQEDNDTMTDMSWTGMVMTACKTCCWKQCNCQKYVAAIKRRLFS